MEPAALACPVSSSAGQADALASGQARREFQSDRCGAPATRVDTVAWRQPCRDELDLRVSLSSPLFSIAELGRVGRFHRVRTSKVAV